mgnify:CR=1 FL=1
MNVEDVYRRQRFGQMTGMGSRPALLVVDFVNGFHDPEIFGGGNIPDAVIATAPLLDFARSNALPVIFTRIVYAADGSDASLWCQKVPRLRDLTEDAPASQIVDSLAPRDGESGSQTHATMALSTNRKTMDGDREFAHLTEKLIGVAPTPPRHGGSA